jgi:hypothetical protein
MNPRVLWPHGKIMNGFTALWSSRGAGFKRKAEPQTVLPLHRSPTSALGSLPSVALSSAWVWNRNTRLLVGQPSGRVDTTP